MNFFDVYGNAYKHFIAGVFIVFGIIILATIISGTRYIGIIIPVGNTIFMLAYEIYQRACTKKCYKKGMIHSFLDFISGSIGGWFIWILIKLILPT